ncbi:MAG: hypothetical protein M5U10_06025 [Candidatus Methanoperedens sp.]|nr:hypothetical protein [Candidatus Methanoperedens nitroreducens]MDJ1421453.1 hypothetical protein [Candidatus Methanoperedens sp.]
MNTKTIVAVAIILSVLGAGYALARPGSGDSWDSMMGGNRDGNGMMESYGSGITGGLSGMMGQYTGMMNDFGNGIWNGMMGVHSDMMGHGNGNDHCGASDGYAGSGYGANATP